MAKYTVKELKELKLLNKAERLKILNEETLSEGTILAIWISLDNEEKLAICKKQNLSKDFIEKYDKEMGITQLVQIENIKNMSEDERIALFKNVPVPEETISCIWDALNGNERNFVLYYQNLSNKFKVLHNIPIENINGLDN